MPVPERAELWEQLGTPVQQYEYQYRAVAVSLIPWRTRSGATLGRGSDKMSPHRKDPSQNSSSWNRPETMRSSNGTAMPVDFRRFGFASRVPDQIGRLLSQRRSCLQVLAHARSQ